MKYRIRRDNMLPEFYYIEKRFLFFFWLYVDGTMTYSLREVSAMLEKLNQKS